MSNRKYVKIEDLQTNDALTIRGLRCRRIGTSEFLADQGRIELRGDNYYGMVTEHGIFNFSVSDPQDERQLADRMKQYPYNLACISGWQNGQDVFFLHVAFFFRADRKSELNVVLSEDIKKTLFEKHFASKDTIESDVQANFLLTDGRDPCYAVTVGKYKSAPENGESPSAPHAQDDDREDDSEDDADAYRNLGQSGQERKTLVLYGRDYALRVKLMGENEESFFYADSVDTRMRHIPPMALFIGDLMFKDGKRFAAESIKRELDRTQGYLEVWDRYTGIEGDFLLDKARKVGRIDFDRKTISYVSGGFLVYPKGLSDKKRELLAEGDELLVSKEVPAYITDKGMTWIEYKKWLAASASSGTLGGEKPTILKLVKVDKGGSWILSSKDGSTFPCGTATLSLRGDISQIIRREKARERIANGEASNPALGLLIEGKKSNVALEVKRQSPIEPLSAFVKEKLFADREPRERQREAIRIALNTPDIALIQGPPGTGKTTVITAIVERLNEISDKRQGSKGQVLLTSFQHDAVRNVIERLRINSLPTPKFGRQGSEDLNQERAVEQWRLEYAKRLKERNPEIQQTEEQQELFLRRNTYLVSPSGSNALRFLEYARKLNVDNDLAVEIDRLTANLTVQESGGGSQLLEKLRRLRTTKRGFLDDGPETADDVLMALEPVLDVSRPEHREILDVLEEAADFTGDDVEEGLLKKLSAVRANLISRCTPKPAYHIAKPDPAVLAVFDRLKDAVCRPQGELGDILYNLLNEIENNPEEAESVIGSYSFAYAATAQQSEGVDIKRAKGTRRDEHPEYDTVIIDEAARVNPGDLMIPMSQAKRRIILVGDHRQLPHIYDEEIFDSMRDDGTDIKKDVVTKSMFEYIKEKLQELEKNDHIPRTITLDAQYRMHPVLGEFVNHHFYAPYGEGFESPLGEEHFRQDLSPKPYMWVDIPHRAGEEQRKGISRQRECEADWIVNAIRTYMDSREGNGLTYGIITFYRAQKDLICDKLRKAGLLDKVRVGSVDAFQGMEFDVIFLSTVRTHSDYPKFDGQLLGKDTSGLDENGKEYAQWQAYKEEIGMRYYGRLVSENLLCVALSRQKKLLIVVGDAAIFHEGKWGELAGTCVPAMRSFYELCKKGEMVIHGNA